MKRKFFWLLCLQSLYVCTSEKNGNHQFSHSLPASSGPIRRSSICEPILNKDSLKSSQEAKTGQTLSHEPAKNLETTLGSSITKGSFGAVTRNMVSYIKQNKQDENTLTPLATTEVTSSPKNDSEVVQSIDLLNKNKRLKAIEEKLDALAKDTKEERVVVSKYLSKIITLQESMEQIFTNIKKSIESMDTRIKSLETKIDTTRGNTAAK